MNTELLDEMADYFYGAWENVNSTLENDHLIPADWMKP